MSVGPTKRTSVIQNVFLNKGKFSVRAKIVQPSAKEQKNYTKDNSRNPTRVPPLNAKQNEHSGVHKLCYSYVERNESTTF